MRECNHREGNYTPKCGGAFYWWCNRDNKQINVHEDCKECDSE